DRDQLGDAAGSGAAAGGDGPEFRGVGRRRTRGLGVGGEPRSKAVGWSAKTGDIECPDFASAGGKEGGAAPEEERRVRADIRSVQAVTVFRWGRLVACGGLAVRFAGATRHLKSPNRPSAGRRLAAVAQVASLPHWVNPPASR